MLKFSKPRTKFYGCASVYYQILRDFATFRFYRGRDWKDVERQAAHYFGCDHAVATPLARVGIYLCLKYLIREQQYVLQSPYTLAEVINMTTCAGGIPLFSDVDPYNAHLDPRKLPAQENIGAMLVTHLHGIPAEMNHLMDYSRKHGIPVIEDAAQSAGTKYQGKYVGTIGDAGVLSFGILKQLNSVYGGMVLTNDGELAEFVRHEMEEFRKIPLPVLLDKLMYLMRMHLMASNPVFSWLVFPLLRYGVLHDVDWINAIVAVQPNIQLKRRLDDWYHHRPCASQARMLARQLPSLHQHDSSRIAHAEHYLNSLAGLEGLRLPQITPEMGATFAHFPIQVRDPQGLLAWFNYYGQDVVAQHFANCAELPCFSDYARDCPEASRIAESLVLLPTYPGFGKKNVERNVEIIKRYFELGQPTFEACDRLGIIGGAAAA